MKFFIVLFAVVAAASAGYAGGYDHVEQPWVVPAAVVHSPVVHSPVVHAPVPWVAPAPKYVKVADPVAYAKAPHVHHVVSIPQHPPVPSLLPKPVDIKGNDHVTRIHYHAPHVPHPHLVGVEHYEHGHEPAISVVKAHGHGY